MLGETMVYTESFFNCGTEDGTLRSPEFPSGGAKGNTQGSIRAPVTVRFAAPRSAVGWPLTCDSRDMHVSSLTAV